jgi:diguanylate cyclase
LPVDDVPAEELIARARVFAAEGRFEEALLALDAVPDDAVSAVARFDAHLDRGRVLDRLGRYDEALRCAEDAVEAAMEIPDHGRVARAAAFGACSAVHFPDLRRAVDLAVIAMVHIEEPDVAPAQRAVALANLGYLLASVGALHSGAEFSARALHLLEADPAAGGLPLLRMNTATYLAVLHGAEEEPSDERAAAVWNGLLRVVDDPSAPAGVVAMAGVELAVFLFNEGRGDDAMALLDRLDVNPCREMARTRSSLRRLDGLIAQRDGDHAVAIGCFDDALALAEQHTVRWVVPHIHQDRAASYLALGDVAAAMEALQTALRTSLRTGYQRVERLAGQMFKRATVERQRMTLERRSADLLRANEEDPLTGLGNRRRFERLTREAAEGDLALLVCDLDQFKSVNDRFGHDVGDAVLCRAAAALRSALRPGDHLVRWGGEEFVAVVATQEEWVARAVGERMRRAMRRERWSDLLDMGEVQTISIGAAVGAMHDHEGLFRAADAALYRAKASGRDRVVVSSP